MRYNFNDNSIVVSYIKELLHNFNLPMISVCTDNLNLYKDKVYIKGNDVYKYDGNELVFLHNYSFNKRITNLTKNLIINSSTYDYYTHKYLGNYLRFLRDYKNIDLISLYNCFFDSHASNINYTFSWDSGRVDEEGAPIKKNFEIDTDDANYAYYIVPAKFNKEYTIAINSSVPYEIACVLYDNKLIKEKFDALTKLSYKKITNSNFSRPFLYRTEFKTYKEDHTVIKDYVENYWKYEKDLCILLKIPNRVNSTITILEGNYVESCNVIDGLLISDFKYDENEFPSNYISKNGLLTLNNGKSYPFSPRLIEYLLDNAITGMDRFSTDIERVQDVLYRFDSLDGFYGIWSDDVRNKVYKKCQLEDITKGYRNKSNKIYIQSDQSSENSIEYDIVTKFKSFKDNYSDLLYYVDKDVEYLLDLQ